MCIRDRHWVRLNVISGLTFIVSFLLPLFFLVQFQFSKVRIWLAAILTCLIVTLLFVPGFDRSSSSMLLISFIFAQVITLIAVRLNQKGAVTASIAVGFILVSHLLLPLSFPEQYIFPAFILFVLIQLFSLTQRMKQTQEQKNIALINASQLEVELLKRNIQPHFILNTLTSIEQWIEESPKTAVDFIDALADEFRILISVSDKTLIPLIQEIDLCKSHLKIMSYRKAQNYHLETININPKQQIPPAIIHTLIENILSHNRYSEENTTITLQQVDKAQPDSTILELTSPITSDSPDKMLNTGTGLKYIKARLNQSFNQQWKLTETVENEHWITRIEMANTL